MNGKVRTADVGLLYDPARSGELQLSARWKAMLARALPWARVRRNYPYAGSDDGFMPYLRGRFRPADYIGVEIEFNQAHALGAPRRFKALRAAVVGSLRAALTSE